MKKFALIIVLLVVVFAVGSLAGCSSAPVPSSAWGEYEKLEYKITDTDSGESKGTLTLVTERINADNAALRVLNGETFSSANVCTTVSVETDKVKFTTVILSYNFNIRAVKKDFTDLIDASKSYVLTGKLSGKDFVYNMGGESKKLRVGNSAFTLGEFVYHYIRCYDVGSLPSVKILNVKDNVLLSVASSVSGTSNLDVNYPDGEVKKGVSCNAVKIDLSATPAGSPIYVWYTPDASGYNIKSGEFYLESKKIPAKIKENDYTYILSGVSVNKD